MKSLDWFRPQKGEFTIRASLQSCIRYLDGFPEQVGWDAYYKGYSVKNRERIKPNKFRYMLMVAKFRGMPTNYLAKLNVELEAIDDNTTQAKCVAQISTNLVINCVIGIAVGLILSFIVFPLIFVFGGLFLLYAGFQSSVELIEFHHKQWLMIPTRSSFSRSCEVGDN